MPHTTPSTQLARAPALCSRGTTSPPSFVHRHARSYPWKPSPPRPWWAVLRLVEMSSCPLEAPTALAQTQWPTQPPCADAKPVILRIQPTGAAPCRAPQWRSHPVHSGRLAPTRALAARATGRCVLPPCCAVSPCRRARPRRRLARRLVLRLALALRRALSRAAAPRDAHGAPRRCLGGARHVERGAVRRIRKCVASSARQLLRRGAFPPRIHSRSHAPRLLE